MKYVVFRFFNKSNIKVNILNFFYKDMPVYVQKYLHNGFLTFGKILDLAHARKMYFDSIFLNHTDLILCIAKIIP